MTQCNSHGQKLITLKLKELNKKKLAHLKLHKWLGQH